MNGWLPLDLEPVASPEPEPAAGPLTLVSVFVPGTPKPQGSAKWIRSNTTGRAIPKTNPDLLAWRDRVAGFAAARMAEAGAEVTAEPVALVARFVFQRPKGHVRRSGDLTRSAPRHHGQRPDVDKLIRAVGDALTGVVYRDDCQVVEVRASKAWAAPGCPAGLSLEVSRVET